MSSGFFRDEHRPLGRPFRKLKQDHPHQSSPSIQELRVKLTSYYNKRGELDTRASKCFEE